MKNGQKNAFATYDSLFALTGVCAHPWGVEDEVLSSLVRCDVSRDTCHDQAKAEARAKFLLFGHLVTKPPCGTVCKMNFRIRASITLDLVVAKMVILIWL